MAGESHQDKGADCTDVQPVIWNQTDVIIRKICTFLGPNDLKCFRLVCKKWKDESSLVWEHHRTCHTVNRFDRLNTTPLDAASLPAFHNQISALQHPWYLTVFSEYRPPQEDCDFDCVGAEDLRKFFLFAKQDDPSMTQVRKGSFQSVKLREWNRFGNFPSGEQAGAKWFLKEIADKVTHLCLDRCDLFISQGEFFPTLCKLTKLEELTIQGTYFQLCPSSPVEATLAEISPLPDLLKVEMNYENCTVNKMARYNFPWNVFLRALTNKDIMWVFSYSDKTSLKFGIQEFSKMIAVANQLKTGKDNLAMICFKNLSEAKDAAVLKKDVMGMVSREMKKLHIRVDVQSQEVVKNFHKHLQYTYPGSNMKPKYDMIARLQSFPVVINFLDKSEHVI